MCSLCSAQVLLIIEVSWRDSKCSRKVECSGAQGRGSPASRTLEFRPLQLTGKGGSSPGTPSPSSRALTAFQCLSLGKGAFPRKNCLSKWQAQYLFNRKCAFKELSWLPCAPAAWGKPPLQGTLLPGDASRSFATAGSFPHICLLFSIPVSSA